MTTGKLVFCEQRKHRAASPSGPNPFTTLRVPKIFNLRMDPYERADMCPTNTTIG